MVTPSHETASKWGRSGVAGWVAFLLAALGTIFFLPQIFPVSPSISASYWFGYNNRVGVLFFLLFLVAGGLLWRRPWFAVNRTALDSGVPRKLVWQWMGIFAAGWVLMYVFTHGMGGFGESVYLIDRLKMLARGETPYRDFEFAYGALFLYFPRVLMFLKLTAEQSYYISWLLSLLAGVWMLAKTLNLLDYSYGRKAEVFSLLCWFAFTMVISTGMNYTLLRFLPASYFALLVERTDTRGNRVRAMLMMAGFTMLTLLISPEIGLAYAVGSIGYFILSGWKRSLLWDRQSLSEYAGLLFGIGIILLGADKLGVFGTLKAFGNGAFSFPIIPAGHILLFFFTCGLAVLYMANCLRSEFRGTGLLAVLAVSVGTIFAALGRCDPGHVGFAAIGIFLAGGLLASSMPRIWTIYRIAFIIFFIVAPTTALLLTYQSTIAKVFLLRVFQMELHGMTIKLEAKIEQAMVWKLGEQKARRKFEELQFASRAPSAIDLKFIYPGATRMLEAPFGVSLNGVGAYQSSSIDGGYYFKLNNAFTSEAMTMKIAELRAHSDRDLLLPEDFDNQCNIDLAAERHTMRILFAFPYPGSIRHRDNVWAPLCNYIHDHYQESERTDSQSTGYNVWKNVQ